MPALPNSFKVSLIEERLQIGLWMALANAYTAEVCAGAGYDWLLIDGEHAPNDIPSILAQLQAVGRTSSHAIVRPPIGEAWLIKQILDLGAQTILVPMVESGEQARDLVKAVRYPPHGVRGIGAGLARASSFNRDKDYLQTANDEICLLVQIESRAGIEALEDIARTDGVDGVFIGPADLAADMGFLGRPDLPEVVEVVIAAIGRLKSLGKPAGLLTADRILAQRYVEAGASFVAIGSDVGLLATQSTALLQGFQQATNT
tara:strand:- start:60933 stop:61712 length:780 start_codon:yes stop_codon:yes gene_type:complete